MDRDAMNDLVRWKESRNRKPLIVNGARQVGKTWLVKEFGRRHFGNYAYVNFLDDPSAATAFEQGLSPQVLVDVLSALTGTSLNDGSTLLFLDEIQECPLAITSLKTLCERHPHIPVVAAGSLLGVALARGSKGRSARQPSAQQAAQKPDRQPVQSGGLLRQASWPVGKVDYLDMHPMTFLEFLRACGQAPLADLVESGNRPAMDALSEALNEHLRLYFCVGGMPEAVQAFLDTRDPSDAREVQKRLLADYEHDFAKHVETAVETEHIREAWRSVPRQIARESNSRKFTYTAVREGGRGRDYKDTVAWLVDAGLVTRVENVSKPGIPLSFYRDEASFKLYLLDIGLLGAATGLSSATIIEGNRLFTEFKGAYAEQYVCQQLVASNACTPYYWSFTQGGQKNEVDFLYELDGEVVPVEVKADVNVKSSSLATYAKKFSAERSVRCSLKGWHDEGWLLNVPLFAANLLPLRP